MPFRVVEKPIVTRARYSVEVTRDRTSIRYSCDTLMDLFAWMLETQMLTADDLRAEVMNAEEKGSE